MQKKMYNQYEDLYSTNIGGQNDHKQITEGKFE